jgi:hypothetical protein
MFTKLKSAIGMIVVLIAAAVGGTIGKDLVNWAMEEPIDREKLGIAMEKRLEEERKRLPMRLDEITMLWWVDYDEKNMVMIYGYRLDVGEQDVIYWDKLIARTTRNACTEMKKALGNGISFRYVYNDKKDRYLGKFVVSSKDCKKLV